MSATSARSASDRPPGRILVLNGASSAGKSALARLVQQMLAEAESCWVIFSWDDFVPRLPERWHGGPDVAGDLADAGCRYRVVDDAGQPAALLEVGVVGARMLAAYHRVIATVARSGLNVIVEEVMITDGEWHDWQRALSGLDVRWVAVHCDLATAVAREHERGDRYPGLARGTSHVVHQHAVYDAEVDASASASEGVAVALVQRLGPWLTDT